MKISIKNGRTKFFQYDKEQKLILDEYVNELHFSNSSLSQAITKEVYQEEDMIVCDVPDIILETSGVFTVYSYIKGTEEEYTIKAFPFKVEKRPLPDGYVPESEIPKWEDLEQRVEELEQGGGSSSSGITDVRINDNSIVTDGKANIPLSSKDVYGVVKPHTSMQFTNGELGFKRATQDNLSKRNYWFAIDSQNIDIAVKSAMCDGVGTEWTNEEKASARNRMGINTYELITDVTTEEEITVVEFDTPRVIESLKIYIVIPKVSAVASIRLEHNGKNIGYTGSNFVSTSATKYLLIECNCVNGVGVLSSSKHGSNPMTMGGEIILIETSIQNIDGKVSLNFASGFPTGTHIMIWGM